MDNYNICYTSNNNLVIISHQFGNRGFGVFWFGILWFDPFRFDPFRFAPFRFGVFLFGVVCFGAVCFIYGVNGNTCARFHETFISPLSYFISP